MGEVINHHHTTNLSTFLLAASNPFKAHKALADLIRRKSGKACRAHRHRCISYIELTHHGHFVTLTINRKPTPALDIIHFDNSKITILTESHFFNGTRRISRCRETVFIITIDQRQTTPGNDFQQALKGQNNLIEIIVDIGVIKLDVVHHDKLRKVMQKLGSLVKKSRVVFVAFHHNVIRFRKSGSLPEVRRNSPYHKTRFLARRFKQPGQHRTRSGLPMRPTDDIVLSSSKKIFLQHFGQRHIPQAPI